MVSHNGLKGGEGDDADARGVRHGARGNKASKLAQGPVGLDIGLGRALPEGVEKYEGDLHLSLGRRRRGGWCEDCANGSAREIDSGGPTRTGTAAKERKKFAPAFCRLLGILGVC